MMVYYNSVCMPLPCVVYEDDFVTKRSFATVQTPLNGNCLVIIIYSALGAPDGHVDHFTGGRSNEAIGAKVIEDDRLVAYNILFNNFTINRNSACSTSMFC